MAELRTAIEAGALHSFAAGFLTRQANPELTVQ
jgi:hypothetical protein